jgi:hypothetical protein
LILSDPLVSKNNKGKSTMTTSNRRTSQNIDTLKTHEQKVIPWKQKKLNKNKIKTKKKKKKQNPKKKKKKTPSLSEQF